MISQKKKGKKKKNTRICYEMSGGDSKKIKWNNELFKEQMGFYPSLWESSKGEQDHTEKTHSENKSHLNYLSQPREVILTLFSGCKVSLKSEIKP